MHYAKYQGYYGKQTELFHHKACKRLTVIKDY